MEKEHAPDQPGEKWREERRERDGPGGDKTAPDQPGGDQGREKEERENERREREEEGVEDTASSESCEGGCRDDASHRQRAALVESQKEDAAAPA